MREGEVARLEALLRLAEAAPDGERRRQDEQESGHGGQRAAGGPTSAAAADAETAPRPLPARTLRLRGPRAEAAATAGGGPQRNARRHKEEVAPGTPRARGRGRPGPGSRVPGSPLLGVRSKKAPRRPGRAPQLPTRRPARAGPRRSRRGGAAEAARGPEGEEEELQREEVRIFLVSLLRHSLSSPSKSELGQPSFAFSPSLRQPLLPNRCPSGTSNRNKAEKEPALADTMLAATKPCARVRVAASSAASSVPFPPRRRASGPSRPAPLTPGGALGSLLPLRLRRGATEAAAWSGGSSNASSTAAPSIGASVEEDASAMLPDAFALLGLNRAAARASVIQAYDETAQAEIEEGFSKVRRERREKN